MECDNALISAYKQILLQDLRQAGKIMPASISGGSILECACGGLDALRVVAGRDLLAGVTGADLLIERAQFLGLSNPARISANGSCRLMSTKTQWIALNLARDEDWELMPAWLEVELREVDWQSIDSILQLKTAEALVERGRLMGIPVSALDSHRASGWFKVIEQGAANPSPASAPLVVDLSSLWAGPLCSHLLLQAGATVVKVESLSRPDTTRSTAADFHNLINGGKYSVALDLNSASGIRRLEKLLLQADIVIESSRPRALRHWGIHAEELVKKVPGLTWVSITGYGRDDPQAEWVAFGDDAAIAGGAASRVNGVPHFIGDALSDPLTGIHAAVVALAGWQSGKGSLVDISLAGITAFVKQQAKQTKPIDLQSIHPLRTIQAFAPEFGANTEQIFRELVDP